MKKSRSSNMDDVEAGIHDVRYMMERRGLLCVMCG